MSDLSSTTKCDQNHISHICKLVAHKARAKHDDLFIKRSCLAPTIGVTKFIIVIVSVWSHFVVLLKSDIDAQQTYLKTKEAWNS